MTPIEFERRYAPTWQKLEQLLERTGPSDKLRQGDWALERVPSLYREVCQHLALAKDRGYPPFVVARLNALVQRAHQVLYRPKTRMGGAVWDFATREFPCLVRANWGVMLIATAAFYGPLLALGLLVYGLPELAYSVFDPGTVATFERMYNPNAGPIGRERSAESDFVMFGYFIKNNIGISFQVFASGLLSGVGSLFYLVYNGVAIGAVSGYLTQLGYGETFWGFVCGHGSFELTAIVISGGAGLMLGKALLAPGRLTRRAALVAAAKDAVKIIYGVAVMLLVAAFIEAFWSSLRWMPVEVKYSVAALLWALVGYYFAFQGRPAAAAAVRA